MALYVPAFNVKLHNSLLSSKLTTGLFRILNDFQTLTLCCLTIESLTLIDCRNWIRQGEIGAWICRHLADRHSR